VAAVEAKAARQISRAVCKNPGPSNRAGLEHGAEPGTVQLPLSCFVVPIDDGPKASACRVQATRPPTLSVGQFPGAGLASNKRRISIDSHRAAKWSWRLLWLMMAATAIGVSTRSYFALQLFAALVLFTLLFVVLTSIVLAFFVLLEALARLLGRGMDAIRFLKRFVEDSYRAWRTA
jgi:hypothetical protein